MEVAALVLIAGALVGYVTWLRGRLERLYGRVEAAWAALDAQLVRRAAGAADFAACLEAARGGSAAPAGAWPAPLAAAPSATLAIAHLRAAAAAALATAGAASAGGHAEREVMENALGRALATVAEGLREPLTPSEQAAWETLLGACSRVAMARTFYNDAVNLTEVFRRTRSVRFLRLASQLTLPPYFDIDDSLPTAPAGGRPVTGLTGKLAG